MKLCHNDEIPNKVEYYDGRHSRKRIKAKYWYKKNSKQLHRINGAAVITYHMNGNVNTKQYYRNGILHRDNDKPAVLIYNKHKKNIRLVWYINGQVCRLSDEPALVERKKNKISYLRWYEDGLIHRGHNKPAVIRYNTSGKVIEESWYLRGKLHRANDQPAFISYNGDGIDIMHESWYLRGKLHRDNDQPADISSMFGEKTLIWCKNGVCHREYGPAIIVKDQWSRSDERGHIILKKWKKYGKMHRINGPAYIGIRWYDGNLIKVEHWYIDDKILEHEEIINHHANYVANAIPCITEKGLINIITQFIYET